MKKRTKLLVISEVGCGPPFLGNRARVKSLLGELRKLGLEIHFAGVNMSAEEKAATLPHVDHWAWDFAPKKAGSVIANLHDKWVSATSPAKKIPVQKGNADALDRWMRLVWMDEALKLQKRERYDAVLVEYVFHSALLECFGPDCLKVLDAHDVFGERGTRLKAHGIEDCWYTTTLDGEAHGLKRADRVIAIQKNEAAYFEEAVGGDAQVFTVGHITATEALPFPEYSRPAIGYLASDNALNIDSAQWFLREMWPIVKKELPAVELLIGGRICRALSRQDGVHLLGNFESTRDFYLRTHLTINPMTIGSGLKIKTIESLGYGRPMVGTSVACEGLQDQEGRGMDIIDEPETFAKRCVERLSSEAALRQGGGEAVRMIDELNKLWAQQLGLAFAL